MNKKALWKGLLSICAIILLCSIATRVFFKSSETLMEYGQKNPETAYADTTEQDFTENPMDTANTSVSANAAEEPDTASTADTAGTVSQNGINAISPERITYQTDFYYEPLSDELKQYITGNSYPAEDEGLDITYADLRYLHVLHYDFDGKVQDGELICNQAIAADLAEIFYELYRAEYQIEKIVLIDEYNADDDASMEDNNTSCFNYRVVDNTTTLSKHAYGLALDINPFYNPYVRYNEDGSLYICPEDSTPYADRSAAFPYKIDESDLCLKLFKEHGFVWGGDWNSCKDYQHFQKALH